MLSVSAICYNVYPSFLINTIIYSKHQVIIVSFSRPSLFANNVLNIADDNLTSGIYVIQNIGNLMILKIKQTVTCNRVR
jgi:hypothetical protein